ncbi:MULTISPECIES: hypothetical protein [unclassified Thioalkalivibrio]|uniref:hypothetical protein n=1 Tax=unclassified Thioalkalivibrio TaxID=2621013 RepID=UPI0003657C35|nr:MULTISPECIES: hypothetical protein [unclassified Thioalkalivibrio]
MSAMMKRLPCCILGVILASATWATTAHALDVLPPLGDERVVPDSVLEAQRGGFFGRDGLEISIGLEQITSLNGEVINHSTLRPLSDIASGSHWPGTDLRSVVIQTGGAMPAESWTSGMGWVTAIQNELDGQDIRHQTILQLELGNLQMPRGDLGRALEQHMLERGGGF